MGEQAIEGGAWTTPEVLAEMTYVLGSVYEIQKKDICTALNTVFIHVEVRPYDVVKEAIREYEQTKLDFVDCMIVAYAKVGDERVFTFDAEINRRLSQTRKSK